MRFTVNDTVVVDGEKYVVRGIEGTNVRVLSAAGNYVTVTRDDIEGVYWDE